MPLLVNNILAGGWRDWKQRSLITGTYMEGDGVKTPENYN